MNPPGFQTLDANEAVARVAYALNEVIAIYPITPATPMGEWADAWAAADRRESVGHGAHGDRDAERRRRGGRDSRRAADRRAGDDLHGVAGVALDDPKHVQDRGRADAGGLSHRGALYRGSGAFDLWRPQRRNGCARHRLGDALFGKCPGGTGFRSDRTNCRFRIADSVPPFL